MPSVRSFLQQLDTIPPRGTVHTWRNAGDAPARFLTLLSPARSGRWFESARTPEVNEGYGIEFVGALPEAAPESRESRDTGGTP